MNCFQKGEIVVRKSHGADISFMITDITNKKGSTPIYILKGILFRLEADGYENDLIKQDPGFAYYEARKSVVESKQKIFEGIITKLNRITNRPGKILHIDSSNDFFKTCMDYYREAGLTATGWVGNESEQPEMVGKLLMQNRPDVIVITGHDGIKKNSSHITSLDSYRNSRYFVQSVREARRYEPSYDKLCIFAGACQSYYEAIMNVGANFASSPGRILINALDPSIVSSRISLTDKKIIVSPEEVIKDTVSGRKGIGGIKTRGQMEITV